MHVLAFAAAAIATLPVWVAASPCPGDCNVDESVTVEELIAGLIVARGHAPRERCASMDQDNDGQVTMQEVMAAMDRALRGCGAAFDEAPIPLVPGLLPPIDELDRSIEDIGYVRNSNRARAAAAWLAGDAPQGGAADEGACAAGGSVSPSCAVEGPISRFRTSYLDCADMVGGSRVVLNGSLELVVQDPAACTAGGLPPNRDFELRETEFVRTVHSGSTLLERRRAHLTQRFVSAGEGCAGPNGTTWYDGTIEVFDAVQGTDVRFVYQGVSLAVHSEGSPCQSRKTKTGTIQAEDRTQNHRFTERTKDLSITEQALDADTRLVTMTGELDVDCLGALRIETLQPLRFRRGVECPLEGLLALTLRDSRVNGVRFTSQGPGGEVELDLDFQIDRGNCGAGQSCGFMRDTAVPSCQDESLAQCRVVLPPNPERGFCDPEENYALRFEGQQMVSFGAVEPLTEFTIEAWVRPETGARTGFVAGHTGGPSQSCSQGFGLDASAGDFCFSVDPQGCGNTNFLCIEREPDGAWHHLAGTYAGGEARFYIDGELRHQGSGVTHTASDHMTAGAVVLSTGAQSYYTGELDEVRIWSVARTEADIRAAMTKSLVGDEPGLVGYWPMDEGQGQVVEDYSASSRAGVLGATTEPESSDPQWVSSGAPVCSGPRAKLPTPTPVHSHTLTPTRTTTATHSRSPTTTLTLTPTRTIPPSATPSPSPTHTQTVAPTATPTLTRTATGTPVPTATTTPSASPTPTATTPTGASGSWLPGFDLPGANGIVASVAARGDFIYAGGGFTAVGGALARNIARWDGTSWARLGEGVDSWVHAIAVDSAGNVYAGGEFLSAGGIGASRVAKWDGVGWSPLGSGVDGAVRALAIDSAGNVYAGGEFASAGGVPANRVAKWDGTGWSPLGSGMNGTVHALAVDSADNIVVGGSFTEAGGVGANRVARWDGTMWSPFGSGAPDMDDVVRAVAVDGEDKVFAAGRFIAAGGAWLGGLIQWDGATWSVVDSRLRSEVYAVVADGEGGLYVGAPFLHIDGLQANYVAKWDGTNWSVLDKGLEGFTFFGGAAALCLDSTGNLYAGGDFLEAGGKAALSIARWDGNAWHALGSGVGGWIGLGIFGVAFDSTDGSLYAGGPFLTLFSTPAGPSARTVARWDGTSWSALGAGTVGSDPFDIVRAVAVDGSSNVFIAGRFSTAGGVAANRVARSDGNDWLALGAGLQGDPEDEVRALALDGGGNLYAGGRFNLAGGVPALNVARWDGASWSSLGSGVNQQVYALAVDTGGNVYAGGGFSEAGGAPANRVARWDGTTWFPLGAGLNNQVTTLAVDGAGHLYAGGAFREVDGSAGNHVAKWDGLIWSPLGSGVSGHVTALATDAADNLYAAGIFSAAGGVPANGIAKWDGARWLSLGSGVHEVSALTVDPAGRLYAGGQFTEAGGQVSGYLAVWQPSGP